MQPPSADQQIEQPAFVTRTRPRVYFLISVYFAVSPESQFLTMGLFMSSMCYMYRKT